jgi:hypothetical protein
MRNKDKGDDDQISGFNAFRDASSHNLRYQNIGQPRECSGGRKWERTSGMIPAFEIISKPY